MVFYQPLYTVEVQGSGVTPIGNLRFTNRLNEVGEFEFFVPNATGSLQTRFNVGDAVGIKSSGTVVFSGVLEYIEHEGETRGLVVRGRHLAQKLNWRHTKQVTEFILDDIPSGSSPTASGHRSLAPSDFTQHAVQHPYGFEPKEVVQYLVSGSPITEGTIDTFCAADPPTSGNPGIECSFNFTPKLEAIRKIAESLPVSGTASGHWEWRVTNSGALDFRQRVGTDKSATVQFTTGATGNISLISRTVDGHELVNAITVAGAGEQEARYAGFVQDTGSQTTYGLREFVQDEIYYIIGEDPTTAPSGTTLLDRRGQVLISILKQPIELLTLRGLRPPDDLLPGDTVKVIDPFTDTSGNYKIVEMVVNVDTQGGVITDYQLSNVLQRPYKTPKAFLTEILHDLNTIQTTSKGGLTGQGPIVEANVDTTFPLVIPFYVPLEVKSVRSAIVAVAAQNFRIDVSGGSGNLDLSGAQLVSQATTGQVFSNASGLSGTPGAGTANVSNAGSGSALEFVAGNTEVYSVSATSTDDRQLLAPGTVANATGNQIAFLDLAVGLTDGSGDDSQTASFMVYVATSGGAFVQNLWSVQGRDWRDVNDIVAERSWHILLGIPQSFLASGSTPNQLRIFTNNADAAAQGFTATVDIYKNNTHSHTATDAGHSNHSLSAATAGLPTTTRTSEPSAAGGGVALKVNDPAVSGNATGSFTAAQGISESSITSVTLTSGSINGSGLPQAVGLVVPATGAFIDIPQDSFPITPGKFHEIKLFVSGWSPPSPKAANLKAQVTYNGFARQY